MAAGDFLEVYSTPDYVSSHDCVVTCFFIDCAHNIIQFVQTIHRILKQGGTWLNLGPLLYRIEPDYQTLKTIIQDLGFEFETEETTVPCTYSQNKTSMLQYSYKEMKDSYGMTAVFHTCNNGFNRLGDQHGYYRKLWSWDLSH